MESDVSLDAVADLFNVESDPSCSTSSSGTGIEYHYMEYERQPLQTLATTARVTLRLVKKHVLWGNLLWNGGRWLATHFDKHPELVQGKSVCELGAGAGLPSIVAALCGAGRVVCTDYPDSELIDNLDFNFSANHIDRSIHTCRGYLWGSSAEELTSMNDAQPFDLLLLCDLVFNHSEHTKLARSTLDLLRCPQGTAFCVFTHYRPWLVERDLAFLTLPVWREAGWEWAKIAEERGDLLFEADRGDPEVRRTIHAYQLHRLQ